MQKPLLVIIGVTFLGIAAQTRSPGTAADEAAIRRIREAHDVAYNKHDAKALANLYAVDCDRVTNAGVFYSGRAGIEKSYADAFRGPSQHATVRTESSSVRFLTSDTALLDVESVISGRADGTVKNHVASIYVKRNGKWVLVAERATRIQ